MPNLNLSETFVIHQFFYGRNYPVKLSACQISCFFILQITPRSVVLRAAEWA